MGEDHADTSYTYVPIGAVLGGSSGPRSNSDGAEDEDAMPQEYLAGYLKAVWPDVLGATKLPYNWSAGLGLGTVYTIRRPRPVGRGRRP